MTKHHIIAKAQKRTRRNRQEYARDNDLHFVDRQPKDEAVPTSDDAGIIAMATVLALATNKRLRKPATETENLTAEQLRLRAVKRAKEERDEKSMGDRTLHIKKSTKEHGG